MSYNESDQKYHEPTLIVDEKNLRSRSDVLQSGSRRKIKMYSASIAVLLVLLVYYSHGGPIHLTDETDTNESTNVEFAHPFYSTVRNLNIAPEVDCALRAFTIEMAGYIAPVGSKNNWTDLSRSAFQMNECNATAVRASQPSHSFQSYKPAEPIEDSGCDRRIFVHAASGNDLYEGTFQRPFQTIETALSMARAWRTDRGAQEKLCITIRGGTYYLGANATTTSSQIGAIALTSNDSNLVIENYANERVVLSGGAQLKLQWSVHKKTAAGGTIMKAQIPSWINVDLFNELYIDDTRAIVAKYPNGDPATQGLYVDNPGYSDDSLRWLPPITSPSVEVHVDQPYRNGTVFPYYQIGIGGGASVFNPPRNFWSTANPPAGGNYIVPSGLTVKPGSFPRLKNWTNPATGFVHALHGGYWGSWVFEIDSVKGAEETIVFGRGGFQEARGAGGGGAFYVSNIFEELDSPNEWFLDKTTRTLYFMPNGTMPTNFVASQIPCIISIGGSGIDNPAQSISIRGLIFTQTSNTYMRDYMVPSGGDWSVHRGGTIYLTNTKDVAIRQNLFTQLGSNGIAFIDYNQGGLVVLNEFVWLGDSAIILVGTTDGIDGFTVATQPANILIQSNLIHETGIYIKQSSPVLIAVSRSISVVGNLMFNMPRAGININDGFYGNHTLSWNVIFNTVRETGDHGPINTWDRQPFLTDGAQTGVPSLWQHVSYIHHNTLFNNYHSVWPIDHDDGSCFYEDSYNFIIYGGKKNFLGHSKVDHHQIYVYSDTNPGDFGSNFCLDHYAPSRGFSGWDETWSENICVLYKNNIPYNIGNCDTHDLFVPYLANNQIYVPSGTQPEIPCKVDGKDAKLNFTQWQSYGVDLGSIVQTTPDVQTVIEWGRKMLQGNA